jgi:hypothetical protein
VGLYGAIMANQFIRAALIRVGFARLRTNHTRYPTSSTVRTQFNGDLDAAVKPLESQLPQFMPELDAASKELIRQLWTTRIQSRLTRDVDQLPLYGHTDFATFEPSHKDPAAYRQVVAEDLRTAYLGNIIRNQIGNSDVQLRYSLAEYKALLLKIGNLYSALQNNGYDLSLLDQGIPLVDVLLHTPKGSLVDPVQSALFRIVGEQIATADYEAAILKMSNLYAALQKEGYNLSLLNKGVSLQEIILSEPKIKSKTFSRDPVQAALFAIVGDQVLAPVAAVRPNGRSVGAYADVSKRSASRAPGFGGTATHIPLVYLAPSIFARQLLLTWEISRDHALQALATVRTKFESRRSPQGLNVQESIAIASPIVAKGVSLALVPKTANAVIATTVSMIRALTENDRFELSDDQISRLADGVIQGLGFDRDHLPLGPRAEAAAVARQILRVANGIERQTAALRIDAGNRLVGGISKPNPAAADVGLKVAEKLRALRAENEDLLPPSLGTRFTRSRVARLARNRYVAALAMLSGFGSKLFGYTGTVSGTVAIENNDTLGDIALGILKAHGDKPLGVNGHYTWVQIESVIRNNLKVSELKTLIKAKDHFELAGVDASTVHTFAAQHPGAAADAAGIPHSYAPSVDVLKHRFDAPGVDGPTIDIHGIPQSGFVTALDVGLGALVGFALIYVIQRYGKKQLSRKSQIAIVGTTTFVGAFLQNLIGPHDAILPVAGALALVAGIALANRLSNRRARAAAAEAVRPRNYGNGKAYLASRERRIKSLTEFVLAHSDDARAALVVRTVINKYGDPAEEDPDVLDLYVQAIEAIGAAHPALVSGLLTHAIADAGTMVVPAGEENTRLLRLQHLPPLIPSSVAAVPPAQPVPPEKTITVDGWGELNAEVLIQKINDAKFRGDTAKINRLKGAIVAYATANPAYPGSADILSALIQNYAFASGRYQSVYLDIFNAAAPALNFSLVNDSTVLATRSFAANNSLDAKRRKALNARLDDLLKQFVPLLVAATPTAAVPQPIAPVTSVTDPIDLGDGHVLMIHRVNLGLYLIDVPHEDGVALPGEFLQLPRYVTAERIAQIRSGADSAERRRFLDNGISLELQESVKRLGEAPVEISILNNLQFRLRAAINGRLDSIHTELQEQIDGQWRTVTVQTTTLGQLQNLALALVPVNSVFVKEESSTGKAWAVNDVKALGERLLINTKAESAADDISHLVDHWLNPATDDQMHSTIFATLTAVKNVDPELLQNVLTNLIAGETASDADEAKNPRLKELNALVGQLGLPPSSSAAAVVASAKKNPIADLPPLREGYLRLTHITSDSAAQHIVQVGLDYSSQGMITSTVRAYADAHNVEYFSTDPRFSNPRISIVVFDVPEAVFREHNNPTSAPGLLPVSFIVGVVAPEKATQHQDNVISIFASAAPAAPKVVAPADFAVGQVWISETGARLRIVKAANAGIQLTVGYSPEYAEPVTGDGAPVYKGRFPYKGEKLWAQDYLAGQTWHLEQFAVGTKSYRVQPSDEGQSVFIIPFSDFADEIGKPVNVSQFHSLVSGDLKWEQIPYAILRNNFGEGEMAAMGLTGLFFGDPKLYRQVRRESRASLSVDTPGITVQEQAELSQAASQFFQTLATNDIPDFERFQGRTITARFVNAPGRAPARILGLNTNQLVVEFNTSFAYSLDTYRVALAHELAHVVIHEDMRASYEDAQQTFIGRWIVTPFLKLLEEWRVVLRTRIFRRAYEASLRRLVSHLGQVIYGTPAGNPVMDNTDVNDLVADVHDPVARRQLQDNLNKSRSFLWQA